MNKIKASMLIDELPGNHGGAIHRGCQQAPQRFRQQRRQRMEGHMKALFATIPVALFVACTTSTGPSAPDMRPVGEGLQVIGFALLGVSVVTALGRLLR